MNIFEAHLKSKRALSQEVAHTTFFVKTIEDTFIHVGMYHLGILHESDLNIGVNRIHNNVSYIEIAEWHRNYKLQLANERQRAREEHNKDLEKLRENRRKSKSSAQSNLGNFIVSPQQNNENKEVKEGGEVPKPNIQESKPPL